VDIVFHAHHAEISDHMRERAVRIVRKVAGRVGRAVHAAVRFEEDGRTRRVELVLHAARNRRVVAEASARYFGPALAVAGARLAAQCGVGGGGGGARKRRRVVAGGVR
jgi:hypothetical protein